MLGVEGGAVNEPLKGQGLRNCSIVSIASNKFLSNTPVPRRGSGPLGAKPSLNPATLMLLHSIWILLFASIAVACLGNDGVRGRRAGGVKVRNLVAGDVLINRWDMERGDAELSWRMSSVINPYVVSTVDMVVCALILFDSGAGGAGDC